MYVSLIQSCQFEIKQKANSTKDFFSDLSSKKWNSFLCLYHKRDIEKENLNDYNYLALTGYCYATGP